MSVVLTREDFDGDVARPLLVALDAELDERYTGEGIPPPVHDPAALAEGAVAELDEVEACWRPLVERFAAVAAGRGRISLPLVER